MSSEQIQMGNKNMEYVVAVAKYQSITLAAESLFISQPALSRFIQNLEHRLAIRLFNRLGNKFLLTYEGERYVFYAKKILEIESQMQHELIDLGEKGKGRLRFALPILRSPYMLPSILPPFLKMHPNVEIVISEVHSQFLEKILLEGEADFAIFNFPAKDKNIVSELIRHDEVILALPPDHPLAKEGVRRPDKPYPWMDISRLTSTKFILQPPEQRTRQIADRLFENAGITPSVLLVTRSIEACIRMVLQGLGACFVAETHIRHLTLPSRPAYFSLGDPDAILELSLAYMKNIYKPNYFLDFIDAVKKNF